MISRKTPLILCIALLISLLVPVVSAEVLRPDLVDMNKTISYSDLGLSGPSDILIYSIDPADNRSVLVEMGNTTSGYLYQPINDYQVIQKPSLANRWLGNPVNLFNDLVGFIFANFAVIFVLMAMIAISFGLASYGRKH